MHDSELGKPQYVLCQWLSRISQPAVLMVLIALYLVFVLVLFPALAGDGEVAPLDLMFSYSAEEAYQQIEAYGPTVRHNYAISALTLDVAYPLTYSLMFSVWLTLLIKGKSKLVCTIRMLPFVVLLMDLLENSGIVIMLLNFPTRLDSVATATSVATSLKWVFAGVVILLTLGLSLYRLLQLISQRHRQRKPRI